MNKDKLKEMYVKYNLTKDDVFKHQHYIILTRSGIEKIQSLEQINIKYQVIKSEPSFAVIQAYAMKTYHNNKGILKDIVLETFGSALKGKDFRDGNTNSWYVIEMAE